MKEQFEKEPQESAADEPQSLPDAVPDTEVSAEKEERVAEQTESEQNAESESHHHHHRHHHHHSRRRSTRRSKQKGKTFAKIRAALLKNRKIIGYIALALVLIVLMMTGAVLIDRYLTREPASGDNGGDQTLSETESTIQVEIPVFVESVSLANRGVLDYMSAPISETVNSFWRLYRDHIRMDIPTPVKLAFSVRGLPTGVSIERIEVLISRDATFSESRVYALDKDSRSLTIYNLKTDSTYSFRIELVLSGGQPTYVQGSFTTKDTPRMLYVGGVSNVRDIGGWETVDGKTIRQGLLYRGTELDGAVEPSFRITEEGLVEMLSVLGVKTDMDLRAQVEGTASFDALGPNVTHTYYGAPMYSAALAKENSETMRKIFSDLAKKDAYPIYLHCTYGRDRTGTVCYILEALLGLSEEDLWREYELSAFKDGYVPERDASAFVTAFMYLEGDTLQAKAEGYLRSIGVTDEEIASIRDIFLED